MTQDELKKAVAYAALAYVPEGQMIGVGTGSTANLFIDALAEKGLKIEGAVASSKATADRLTACGFKLVELDQVASLPVYIDGADEINDRGAMIKGGGGALTREKIVASAAKKFICIADESKLVIKLGKFPLPIEIIPMAKSILLAKLSLMGALPELRMKGNEPYVTDNGNWIVDVAEMNIADPIKTEDDINGFPGVVTVGLFSRRGADICLLGSFNGVREIVF